MGTPIYAERMKPPTSRLMILSSNDSIDVLRLLDDRRRLDDLHAENVALDEVGEPDFGFVADELACWD
jgi:hypothetical protein